MKANMALDQLEAKLLLEAIHEIYGYDFRGYTQSSMLRRLNDQVTQIGVQNISELIPKVIHDQEIFYQILDVLPIKVTEMFRDPKFYQSLCRRVFPYLKAYPFLKVWSAGCSTGEEIYSLAISLFENNLLEHANLYGTDINLPALVQARSGIYSKNVLKKYATNYTDTFGKESFCQYCEISHTEFKIHQYLKNHMIFSEHNLVSDGIFNEMHLILCRNVLIYFDKDLQAEVLKLLANSLCYQGYLCLGDKETIMFTPLEKHFKEVDSKAKIYQKQTPGIIT